MQAGRHWVIIRHNSYSFNLHTLRFELLFASRSGVLVTPVESARVRMDPKEALVACSAHFLGPGFSGVLVQVFADHGLGYGLDHARVGVVAVVVHVIVGTGGDVEAVIELRREG
jgi:hypothetical protein